MATFNYAFTLSSTSISFVMFFAIEIRVGFNGPLNDL